MAIAFAAPMLLGLFPRLLLPSVVLEILAGIVAGPSVLGIVEVDAAVSVVALLGLAFVLFLAGLEIEFEKLRVQVLRITVLGFALSFAIALAVSLGLEAGGLVDTPLLVAIILLTIFFSGEGGTGSTLLLLGALLLLAATVLVVVRGAEHSMRIRANLVRLQDTTAQIRVRATLVLLVGFAALAETLGLEAILGAFIAGTIVSLADRDAMMTHPDFRPELEAVGFGLFVPAFFVTSGVRFDLDALTASASSLLMVPIFVVALLAARGLPAIVYRRALDARHTAIAGLMLATSLPFIVAATAIGMELGLIDAAAGAALIGAGLLSVLLFPLGGLLLLRCGTGTPIAGEREPGA